MAIARRVELWIAAMIPGSCEGGEIAITIANRITTKAASKNPSLQALFCEIVFNETIAN